MSYVYVLGMITGIHALIYSERAEILRAFFRDTLNFPSVDAGRGWLIFGLPPAELAVHPGEASSHELYLMCDNLTATIAELEAKGVSCDPVTQAGFGAMTSIQLPDGSKLGLYEPRHATALGLKHE